jgi:hypothetical protein
LKKEGPQPPVAGGACGLATGLTHPTATIAVGSQRGRAAKLLEQESGQCEGRRTPAVPAPLTATANRACGSYSTRRRARRRQERSRGVRFGTISGRQIAVGAGSEGEAARDGRAHCPADIAVRMSGIDNSATPPTALARMTAHSNEGRPECNRLCLRRAVLRVGDML